MAYDRFASSFVRDSLEEVDAWGGPGAGLAVEHLGPLTWRLKLGDADGPQVLYLRVSPSAAHLEPYLNEPSAEEVAALKAGFTDPADVVFPYLRGGRGRGALLRVRNPGDLRVVGDVVLRRAKAARAT